jgi:hypothetical protein
MQTVLKNILDEDVRLLNRIISNAFNAVFFKSLLEETGREHPTLLLHAEVKGILRGKNACQNL